MAHPCGHGNLLPIAPAPVKFGPDFNVEGVAHPRIIAKYCDFSKQHFASGAGQTARMDKKPVNQVLAEALTFFMGTKWNNVTLAKASGVAESTIRNYRAPEKRDSGKSGKAPSAKLSELEMLACALGVSVADLVSDAGDEERARRHRAHAAAYYEEHGHLPSWAPDLSNSGKPQDKAAA